MITRPLSSEGRHAVHEITQRAGELFGRRLIPELSDNLHLTLLSIRELKEVRERHGSRIGLEGLYSANISVLSKLVENNLSCHSS